MTQAKKACCAMASWHFCGFKNLTKLSKTVKYMDNNVVNLENTNSKLHWYFVAGFKSPGLMGPNILQAQVASTYKTKRPITFIYAGEKWPASAQSKVQCKHTVIFFIL